jgi:protein-tyrosine phosphatase
MSATGPAGGEPLLALVVCTGNICRSPAAELLLRGGLGPDSGIEVASAGLDALAGEPMAEGMSRRLQARGVDPSGFTARQLQPAAVRDAGLILTMTAAQRRAVVTEVPAAVRRTFTLVEFVEVAELTGVDRVAGGPGERVAEVLQAAPRARALRARASGQDDIEDPYRRSDEVFARVFSTIDAAVERLLRVLRASDVDGAVMTQGDAGGVTATLTRAGDDTR